MSDYTNLVEAFQQYVKEATVKTKTISVGSTAPNGIMVYTTGEATDDLLVFGDLASQWFSSQQQYRPLPKHSWVMSYCLVDKTWLKLLISEIVGSASVIGSLTSTGVSPTAPSTPVDVCDTLANTLTKQELVEVTILTALIQKSDAMSQLMDTRAGQTNRMIGEARFIANQYLNHSK